MKYYIFLLTLLSSVGFFNPYDMFSEQMQKALLYLCITAAFAIAYLENRNEKPSCTYPRKAYILLMLGIAVSIFSASAFHMQSLSVSVVATSLYLFSYGFFLALVKLDLPERSIINTFICLCAISSVVYFCNAATFPQNIFGKPILSEDVSRGIVRIPLVFIEAFPMIVFYSINKWLMTKNKKWLFIMAWAFFMIIMSVVRQMIVLTAVIGLFFFLRNVSWKVKATIGAAIVAVVVFVLPMVPMYKAMIELSEKQTQENQQEEDIRIQAWRFYTYENQTNAITPIIGNGVPSTGNSRWGIELESEIKENGCLFVDVSWAGFFWFFGGVATFALIYLIIKAILKKKREEHQYLNYTLALLAITSVACGIVIYYFQIIVLMTFMYLAYKNYDETAEEITVDTNGQKTIAQESDDKPKGYPQLRSRHS